MIFKKYPEREKLKLFLKLLNRKEKILFSFFVFCFFFFLSSIFLKFYIENTKVVPSFGGTHIEGLLGEPRFINPIYLESDVDKDIVEILFSGLMKYDNDLNIVFDLAEKYEIEEDGRVYRFFLKDNIFWQDGVPITTEDIFFTIKLIQDPDYKSHFRPNWIGVEIEKIDNKEIKFKLKKPYSSFLENLTLKIMPKHIWQDISSQRFFSDANHLNPIGSGPYKIDNKKINEGKIESITFSINPYYHFKKPFIEELKFIFFDNETSLLSGLKRGKINSSYVEKPIDNNLNSYRFYFPRYFALFFNLEGSELLQNIEIRKALNYATDKKSLLKEILREDNYLIENQIIDSPVLPSIYNINNPETHYDYNREEAINIFEDAGFKTGENGFREKITKRENSFQFREDLEINSKGKEVEELQRCFSRINDDVYPEKEITGFFGQKTEDAVIRFQEKYKEEILTPSGFSEGTGMVGLSTRRKLNEICFKDSEEIFPLSFTIRTIENNTLYNIANLIKKQWEEVGIRVEIETISKEEREEDLIRSRNYEILLLGKVLGALPDFFPFWHSTQKMDPGYNLSLYENEKADKILEEIRESINEEERKEKIEELQEIIINDAPAIFLYSPYYIYLSKTEGIGTKKIASPSKRFIDIENWFIKTKRVWN